MFKIGDRIKTHTNVCGRYHGQVGVITEIYEDESEYGADLDELPGGPWVFGEDELRPE